MFMGWCGLFYMAYGMVWVILYGLWDGAGYFMSFWFVCVNFNRRRKEINPRAAGGGGHKDVPLYVL